MVKNPDKIIDAINYLRARRGEIVKIDDIRVEGMSKEEINKGLEIMREKGKIIMLKVKGREEYLELA